MVFSQHTGYQTAYTYDDYLRLLNSGHKYISCFDVSENNTRPLLVAAGDSKLLGLGFHYSTTRKFTAGWTAKLEELQDNEHLQELRFYKAPIGSDEAEAFGLLIKRNNILRALWLEDVQLTNTTFLREPLRKNATLQCLTISYTNMAKRGISGLAQGLRGNRCLEVLRLPGLAMGDSGAVALGHALQGNSHLVTLVLRFNEIQSKGGIALAQSLKRNSTLTSMDLADNNLGNKTAEEFGRVLGVGGNCTLKELLMENSNISSEGLVSLLNAVLANEEIERLSAGSTLRSTRAENKISKRISDNLRLRKDTHQKHRRKAFEQAMCSETAAPWLRSKLMVVGRGAAGKTNTVRSLLGLQFNPEWDSTVGIDLTEITTTDGQRWQKAYDEDFASTFVHRLAAVTLEEAEEPPAIKEKKAVLTEEKGTWQVHQRVHTTGPKKEREDVVPSKVKFKAPTFQYQEDLLMQQADSKDAVRMAVWDYGGQMVFYTLHHLFLTQYGVYLIVFNLKQLLSNVDESSEYILFWLNSIKLHAPNAPVILVGTFLDKVSSWGAYAHWKLRKVSAVLDKLCAGLNQVCKFETSVYCPISNKDMRGIQSLRQKIEHETNNADFVQIPVSLKWMRGLDILLSLEQQWIKLEDLKVELASIGMEQEEEIGRMLELFHELGVVLYFSASVRLKEVVISKPEWLLEKLSLVIRDKDVHNYDTGKLDKAQLTADLNYFLQQGIVSIDLLEFWWDKSQVKYLVELMRHLMLLSDWTFSEHEQYLIPSMVTAVDEAAQISGVQFCFEFTFLPQGVFERLCCLCVENSSSLQNTAEPKLYKTSCIVDLGANGLILMDVKERNAVTVTVSQTSEASMILDFFLSMMRKIQHDFMHGGLQWELWVGKGDKRVRYEEAQTESLEPWVRKKETVDTLAIDKLLDL